MTSKLYTVVATILLILQHHEIASISNICEVVNNDIRHQACITEAQQLLRSRNVVRQIDVIPVDGTCGSPPTQYCRLVSNKVTVYVKYG